MTKRDNVGGEWFPLGARAYLFSLKYLKAILLYTMKTAPLTIWLKYTPIDIS